MAYTYSKTDWKSTDFFEVEDWIRIRDNYFAIMDDLQEVLDILNPPEPDIADYRSNLDRPFYDDVNGLEMWIQELFNKYMPGVELPLFDQHTWVHPEHPDRETIGNPSADDWNRWEKAIKLLEGVPDGIRSTWVYSGEVFSGEV